MIQPIPLELHEEPRQMQWRCTVHQLVLPPGEIDCPDCEDEAA